MESVKAVLIDAIEGTSPSDDGKHVLLKLRSAAQQSIFAFTLENSFQLVTSMIDAYEKCRKLQAIDRSEKFAMNVEGWEFGLAPDGQLVLSFRLPGGMEMAFRIHQDRISQMRETLQSLEGVASTDLPPGTSRQ
jgi:hypothetical protein